MAKSKIKKYEKGGSYTDEYGKPISKAEFDERDRRLTESIRGYTAYDQQQKEKKRNLAEEAARKAKLKNPVAASTYVKKPQVKMKSGGSLKPVDSSKNPGLAKLPTAVRNNMGYKKDGGQVKMKMGGSCSTPKRLKK
jgi:hypothetical protein